jgi:hypothetical protein
MKDGSEPEAEIHIDLGAVQARLMVPLQRLIDVARISRTGVGLVTEEAYEAHDFFHLATAANAHLPLAMAADAAVVWQVGSVFRDVLEVTNLYLDEVRTVVSLLKASKGGRFTVEEFKRITEGEAARFHKKGIADKLEALRPDFPSSLDFAPYLISIKQVRNCLVHRQGIVGKMDAGAGGSLELRYRAMELFGPGPAGGPDVVIERSGTVLPAGARLMLRARDVTRTFRVGEPVALTGADVQQTILTVMQFSMVLGGELQALAPKAEA